MKGVIFKPTDKELELLHPEFKRHYSSVNDLQSLQIENQTNVSSDKKEDVTENLFGSYTPEMAKQVLNKRKDYTIQGSNDREKQEGERLRQKLIDSGLSKSDANYLTHMAYKESRYGLNTTSAVADKAGAKGIWQFTPITRRTFGYSPDYELSEDEQIDVIKKYIADAKKTGKEAYSVAENKGYTPYSVLASQHLAGATGGKRYWLEGYNPKDANSTSAKDYAEEFNKYNF